MIGLAEDGKRGLEIIRKENPDIVIVDIHMPDMDGLTMLEKMREEGIGCKVIILTVHSDFNYAKRAIELGVVGYLLKPIKSEEMKQVLKQIEKQIVQERAGKHFMSIEKIFLNAIVVILYQMSSLSKLKRHFQHRIMPMLCAEIPGEVICTWGISKGLLNVRPTIITMDREVEWNLFFGKGVIISDDKIKKTTLYSLKYPIQIESKLKTAFLENKISTLVQKVLQYIHEYYNQGIKLEEIAQDLNVSEEYLSKQVRKETGKTFSAILREYKVEKVKKLLLVTSLKMHQIADMAGYSDAKYMSRVFKEEVGMLPSEYRKKNS